MDDNNQRVLVEYTGRLEDGTVFESSEESGPMDITIGAGQVIKGIDEALAEMEVGETRTITIPCEKAFGRYSEYNVQKRDLRYVPNALSLIHICRAARLACAPRRALRPRAQAGHVLVLPQHDAGAVHALHGVGERTRPRRHAEGDAAGAAGRRRTVHRA